jgi:hypothetical protein
MSTDPADTRSLHLDLGELIASASGEPIGDRPRAHLAGCQLCQLEANRWNLVADGVRDLAAAAPESAQPAWPLRTRPRGSAPWRRALLVVASAAAAIIILGGIGAVTGTVHVHLSGHGRGKVLTSVNGCSQLEQADGSLEQVNGNGLIIQTASGRQVIVTTTPSTPVSMSGALLSDITDGASVMVRGDKSGGSLQAAIVTVGQPFSAVNPVGFVPIEGTVSEASTGGFTLVTSSGTRVPVTTSGDTLVVVPHASPGQLQAGTSIFALGSAGPGGTLSARAVAAVSQLPQGRHVRVSVKDCSPASVLEALGAISTAPTSAG